MGTIVFTCKGDTIVSYEDADELLVYDMDSKRLVHKLKKPQDPFLLEDLLEEYDPWVVVSEGVSPEIGGLLRDMGVKLEFTRKRKIGEFLEEVFL